jgi:hypothetical protein
MSNVLKIAELTKVCSRCKIEKSCTEFSYSKKGETGCVPRCKVCVNEVYRIAHPKKDRTKVLPSAATCSTCKVLKPISEFSYKAQNVKRNGGHSYKCKDCHNENRSVAWAEGRIDRDLNNARVKKHYDKHVQGDKGREHRQASYKKHRSYIVNKTYGITLEHARQVLADQLGLCANRGCGIELSFDVSKGTSGKAFIDHCHDTGAFRAILCFQCNTLLGQIENHPNKVSGLLEYSAKFKKINGQKEP